MTTKKPALAPGAGIAALIADNEIKVPAIKKEGIALESFDVENAILYIDIDKIKPNSMQPRQSFDPESIEELAYSIETQGVIQPITLTRADVGYELVTGERRWRAARKAGLKTIPAIVRKVTEEDKALIAIIENMQRENLNTIEEANAFRTIISKYGMTQETLARAVGKSRPHIANTLRTLLLPPEVIEMLRSGELTLGHANALGMIKDADGQVSLAKKIAKNGSSVREAEQLAASLSERKPKKKDKPSRKTNEIRFIEQELTSTIGVRVIINGNDEKGAVELSYYNKQGLDEIIDLLRKVSSKDK